MNKSITQGAITFAAAVAAGSAAYATKGADVATAPIIFVLAALFGVLAGGAQIKDLP